MSIADLFELRVEERIEPVIKVGETDDENKLAAEIGSYVVTPMIEQEIDSFLEFYTDTFLTKTTDIGIWISGYFGSGKSHLAKIMSLLAGNRILAGVSACDRFKARVPHDAPQHNSILRSLSRMNQCETNVLAFNINTLADSKVRPLPVMLLSQYYLSRGYCNNFIYACVIEAELDRQDKLQDLHSAVEKRSGKKWEDIRHNPSFYSKPLFEAACEVAPNVFATPADVQQALKSAESGEIHNVRFLVKTILDDLKKREAAQAKPQRLMLVLDESGQWIENDKQRLSQLQGLVEEAGRAGQGKLWVIVTTHADMGSIYKEARALDADFQTIAARFRCKPLLTTENIELVLEDRLLKKTVAGKTELSEVYAQRGGIVRGLGELANTSQVLPKCDEVGFVTYYPFIPCHIHLIPEIVKSLRSKGGRGEQMSGSTRTLLAITQDVMRAGRRPYLREGIGAIVSFDEIYHNLAGEAEVSADGIPIRIDEKMPFRTFYAICELSSAFPRADVFFTAEDVISKLETIYGGYLTADTETIERTASLEREDWWGDCTPVQFSNIVRLWKASRDNASSAKQAVEKFADSNFVVWKMALALLERFLHARPDRVPPSVLSAIAIADLAPEQMKSIMDCAFGCKGTSSLSYDSANIADHVYRIRLAIHSAFAELGQYIDPQVELLVRGLTPAKEYGYRIIGNVDFSKPTASDEDEDSQVVQVPERKVKVLVVENEPLYSQRIQSLLEDMGFATMVVTNGDDAIRIGLGDFRPDILSLDIHIPATPDEYAMDYRNGSIDNGLQVLGRLRGTIPGIKVLAPTTLFDADSVREQAARMGLQVSNIVPKGVTVDGAPWESLLLLTASRLRNEILLGARLPYVSPTKCPLVRISPDTDLSHADVSKRRLVVTVNDSVSSKKSGNQGMLLALLLSNPREAISKEDLQIAIYGRVANHNEWEGIKKNVRKEIREKWLGVKSDSSERSAFDILKDVGEGLVMHAIVHDPAGRLGRNST